MSVVGEPVTRETLVEVDGIRLWVDRTGQGQVVLCLPAIGHDAHDFDALIARQAPHVEFIRIEWPGSGRSTADTVSASAERYAQLAAGVLDALQVDAPVILGNSIGGAAALLLAARRRVRALILCDSGGLIAITPVVRRFCRIFERFFAAGERGACWYPAAFSFYYRFVLSTPAARQQRARIIAHARRNARIMRQAWASFATPEADLRAIAASLRIPIWVAWCRQDRVIPLRRCRAAIDNLKLGCLSEFHGGHAAFLEQPELFAAGFEKFVQGLSTGS